MSTMEDHSEGRLVNQFCPKKHHFEGFFWREGVPGMTSSIFSLCQKLKSVGLSVSDIVPKSFPSSVSTNAVLQ